MLSTSHIKALKLLQQKKYRRLNSQFIVEGVKLTEELLKSDYKIKAVYALKDWIEKNNYQFLRLQSGFDIIEITERELERISSLITPNEVLSVIEMPDNKLDYGNISNSLTLVLDNLQDPGNIGTIIRTADWFGISQIICSEDCADIYNSKVVQATMGSIFRVKVFYMDLNKFFSFLPKDLIVYGSFIKGESIYNCDLSRSGIIVSGNESKGISENISKYIKGISKNSTILNYVIKYDLHQNNFDITI